MDTKLREEIAQLHAELCSGLADTNRIMILYALNQCNCNVSDLAAAIGLSQPKVSRHLKILRDRGLVTAIRDGQSVHYSLTDTRVITALDILRNIMSDRIREQMELTCSVDSSQQANWEN